jgi:hypothetical protein
VLLRGGDPFQARTLAEKALSLRPDDADARQLLALSFFLLGQLERALVIYEGLLLDAPESASVKVNLAVVLLKLGRASAARPLLESVVGALPDRSRAWGYLGVALEQLGLIAEAEGALLAGHHSSAARKLRQRHALEPVDLDRPHWRPHCHVDPVEPAATTDATAPHLSPAFEERGDDISFELTVPPRHALPPPAVPLAARDHVSPLPLLDAALSSLLVVPHRLSASAHAGGFVVLRMLEGTDPREGGFAARPELVHAVGGSVRKETLARRAPDGREVAPLTRWAGSGRLVLAARGRAQLVPLHLDAGEAFVRGDRVVGFDQRLLLEASTLAVPSGRSLALSRFRGDGEIILELERPALALKIERDETLTVPVDSLVGWIGPLFVESSPDARAELFSVRGEGTLLMTGPATDVSESWD